MSRGRVVLLAVVLLEAAMLAGACGGQGASPVAPANPATTPTALVRLPLTIAVADAFSLVQSNRSNSDFVILDVRTASEFASGHIAGSINIDYYSPDFRSLVGALNLNKRYLMYCRTGVRGAAATQIMADLGFTQVQNLTGGLEQWVQSGYPTVT